MEEGHRVEHEGHGDVSAQNTVENFAKGTITGALELIDELGAKPASELPAQAAGDLISVAFAPAKDKEAGAANPLGGAKPAAAAAGGHH